VPAAFCGIAGLRPTTGRYSSEGCVPISSLFDQPGALARTVADLVLFDSVQSGEWRALEPTALRGIRLGVMRDYWFTDLDPQLMRLTELALERLRAAGAQLIESPLAELPGLAALIGQTTYPVQNHDVRIELARYLERYRTGLSLESLLQRASPDIQRIFRSDILPGGVNFVSEAAYTTARDTHLPALRRMFRDYFARNRAAAIVFPATLVPAPAIGEEQFMDIAGRAVAFDVAVARNIAPGSTAGLPGLVLPIGLTASGLPVALEFDAPAGTDRALLALGLSLERVFGPLPEPRF
jgi:mandelamide amidase